MRSGLALLLIPALAQAADLRLRHQGRLVDASGAPVSGNSDITLRLFDSDVGGTNVQVWADTFTAVPVDHGYYTVELGSGAPFSSDLLSSHAQLWLEAAIGGTTLGARTRLTSVPTAGLSYGVVLPTPGGSTCSVAGMLAYDGVEVKVCDGTSWDDAFDPTVRLVSVSGAARWSDGTSARSCEEYRTPTAPKTYTGVTGDGLYWIDPSGTGPFKVHCDQTTDGGGWTLITSLTDNSAVQAVTSTTLVAPTEPGNKTNRGMALPNVGEILVVQDGKDADGLTTWDKADKIINIVGWSLTYQQVLDALNLNTGLTAGDTSYSTGSDDGWQVAGSRVNTTGCLQTALRGQYGDGNYYGFNGVSSSSIGTIYSDDQTR